MNVILKYDPSKYKTHQSKTILKNIDNYQESLESIKNYGSNDDEWLLDIKNVSERLSFLKESYKLINAFRRKQSRKFLDTPSEMKLETFLSEEDEVSSAENTSPKRNTRRTTVDT